MDPPPSSGEAAAPASEGGSGAGRRTRPIVRCCCSVIVSLVVSLLLSLSFGVFTLLIGRFSAFGSVSVPSSCKIVSSSVDIRSSRVCELGLLNYRAKSVFYPSKKSRLHCRDDYYWASVFEVEYEEYFSGHVLNAVAEAPKEALPLDCRPSFGVAWSTKLRFKVNETYSCKYTPGSSKADINVDNLFNCHVDEPSIGEIIRRVIVLLMSTIFSADFSWHNIMAYAVAGIVSGMVTSIYMVVLFKVLRVFLVGIGRKCKDWVPRAGTPMYLRRAFLLLVYLSVIGCLVKWGCLALHNFSLAPPNLLE